MARMRTGLVLSMPVRTGIVCELFQSFRRTAAKGSGIYK